MDIQQLIDLVHQGPLTAEQLAYINAQTTGLDATLGIQYTQLSTDTVCAELQITEHLLQPFGLLHGGVYCAIAESVGSLAGTLAAGGPVVGVHNATDFLRPARQGVVQVSAQPVHLGSSTQLWQITCMLDGKLLSRTSLRTMVMV